MKSDYILLKLPNERQSGGRPSIELASFKSQSEVTKIDSLSEIVKVKEGLDAQDAEELRRQDPHLFAIPALPMKLVQPIQREVQGLNRHVGVSWGVEAVGALETEATGEGVKIAVLDTGIDRAHPAFQDSSINWDCKNFTSEADEDTDGHGTHCAGIIFGRDVNGYRIGVAPGITDVCIGKVIGKDGGTTATIVKAIQWAWQCGAHIISASLGMDFAGYQHTLVTEFGMHQLAATSKALAGYRANLRLFDVLSKLLIPDEAAMPSALLVAAGGNESERPEFSITVGPPAVAEFAISVGALRKGDSSDRPFEVAGFSNSDVSIAAPGVDITSAKAGETGLISMSGTSMAAPHVAGVAALWAEHYVRQQFNAKTLSAAVIGQARRLRYLTQTDVGVGLARAPERST